jgi:hypothetical protein
VASTRKLENQILSAARDRPHPVSFESAGDHPGRAGPGEPGIEDLDPLEPPPCQDRLEPGSDRLDLRQLGHGVSR